MDNILTHIATAATDLTGEGINSARRRLADCRTWTSLVVSASRDQALLEALILSGLASNNSAKHTFGVVEAFRAEADLLHLRLESSAAVQAVLDLLPYAEKRGTRRGIPGMQARVIGKQLELTAAFGGKAGIYWNAADPKVRIHLQGDEPMAAVLQAHHQRVLQQRRSPHWVPGEGVAPLRRRPPLARDVLAHYQASAQVASALLRRPRMWTALVGHDSLTASSAVSEHGLDWTLTRKLASGQALHDERLVELLQDTVTGPDLHLLDHNCETKSCTLRFTGNGGRGDGWQGVLTVRTEHGRSISSRPGRPLVALGEERAPSHPATRTTEGRGPGPGRCFVLMSGPSSPEAVQGVTVATAYRLVTAWALEGHVSAVLSINDSDFKFSGYSRQRVWPKASVPQPASDVMRWSRLRLTPGAGEAWSANLTPRQGIFNTVEEQSVDTALDTARKRCSRTLVLDQRRSAWAGGLTNRGVDGVIFAFGAGEYPRNSKTPAWRAAVDGDRSVDLSPEDSAALWREDYLGQHDLSRIPLAGLVLLHNGKQQEHSDAFSAQVEEHLRRYGSPVLGWLPPEPGEPRLLTGGGTKTALDLMSHEERAREVAAASAIGGKIW